MLFSEWTPSRDHKPLEVLDLDSGECLWSWPDGRGEVNAAAYMRDGSKLIIAANTKDHLNRIILCDAQTGQNEFTLDVGHSRPSRIAVSPDGALFAAACDRNDPLNGQVRIWELPSGKERHCIDFPAEKDEARQRRFMALTFSLDSRLLLDVNPIIAPLVYNGGPTQTMALLPGSPAIDSGTNQNAPEWDQRGPGYPRIVNGTIDRGAFEVQATGAPIPWNGFAVLITADVEALS
jgi:WD40 repeat protein